MTSQYFKNASLIIDNIEIKASTTIIDVYGKPISTQKTVRIFFKLNQTAYIMDCFKEEEKWMPYTIRHNQKDIHTKTCNYCGQNVQKEPLCSFLNNSNQVLFDFIKNDKQVRLKLLMI